MSYRRVRFAPDMLVVGLAAWLCLAFSAQARTVVLVCEDTESGRKITVDLDKRSVMVQDLDNPNEAPARAQTARITPRQVIWSERMGERPDEKSDGVITYILDRHIVVLTVEVRSSKTPETRKTTNCTKIHDTNS